jgi:hypothetical protein
MLIDFTDDELDIIFDSLDERRMSSDDEEELILIDTIYDKIWKQSKNDNS